MQRAHLSFWTLTAVAIVAAGSAAQALAAPAGAAADVVLVVSLLLLATTIFLLIRVMRHLLGTHRGATRDAPPRTSTEVRARDRGRPR
jgi:ABC-type branched-subunit amino acid transport system permease subunit